MPNFGNSQVIYTDNSYSNITFPYVVIDNISNKDNNYFFSDAIYSIGLNGQIYGNSGSAVGGYGNDTYYVDQGDYPSIYDGSNSPNDSLKIDDYSYNIVFIAAIENHILIQTLDAAIAINHGLTNHGLIENIEFKDIKLNYLNTATTAAFVNNYQYLFNNYWQLGYDLGVFNSPPLTQPTLLDLYNAGLITNIPSISGYNSYSEIIDFINNDLPNIVSLSEASSYDYLASNTDLINAFGSNTNSASNHYFLHGIDEGRIKSGFDPWKYLASNTDLISAFGSDTFLATRHYVNSGFAEGRVATTFDVSQYLTNYPDLVNALNNNSSLAIQHYVQSGYAEGRTDSSSGSSSSSDSSSTTSSPTALSDFEALNYIASHSDLMGVFGIDTFVASIHYVNSGYAEGRAKDDFDEWGYLASNTDLMTVLGSNTTEAIKHYISFGQSEGRSTNIFNAESYLNNYADLKSAFGNDHALATKHYVESGFSEGRVI